MSDPRERSTSPLVVVSGVLYAVRTGSAVFGTTCRGVWPAGWILVTTGKRLWAPVKI